MKKTVIFGATTNPERYACLAAQRLTGKGVEFVPIGIKKGEVFGQPILDLRARPAIEGVHTVTMYMNANNQDEWIDYILSLHPKRIIFNPGAENPKLVTAANKEGIETENACTLVMLGVGTY